MKKNFLYLMMVIILISIALTGCSDDRSSDSKKGAVKTLTDEVAKEAVSRMKSPIDKANAVKEQQEGDFNSMEKTLKE